MKNKFLALIIPLMLCFCTIFLSFTASAAQTEASPQSESAVPDNSELTAGANSFTPNGTGTVVDNATDNDGKEFFTIITEEGNYFYIVIDRQRTSENVYLLNAVTESDLLALAEKSGIQLTAEATPEKEETDNGKKASSDAQEPAKQAQTPSANINGISNETLIYIAAGAVVVGIIGFYVKIVKGKKQTNDDDDEDYEEEHSKRDYDDDYSDEDDDY